MLDNKILTKIRNAHADEVMETAEHLKKFNGLEVEERIVLLSDVVKTLEGFDLKKKKGVYAIFVEKKYLPAIRESLDQKRKDRIKEKTKIKDAYPKVNHENKALDGCIYVGMIREGDLHNRIMKHLNSPKKTSRTSALKLNKWCPREVKKVKLCYIVFHDQNHHKMISEYEKALWNHYKPALGQL